jgi:hypothetical protein
MILVIKTLIPSLTSTVSASWRVLNMGGVQGTFTTSNLRPLASVVDSRISTLREEHSYCRRSESSRRWQEVWVDLDCT